MLMIQVLGVGLIPRGKGIAPKKEPFPADKKTIELILEHGTLIPRMFNQKTGSFITITSKNLNKLWETFGTEKAAAPVPKVEAKKDAPVDKQASQPVKANPQPQPSKAKTWEPPKMETPKVEEKKEEKKEEEKKTDETISVTTSTDKK